MSGSSEKDGDVPGMPEFLRPGASGKIKFELAPQAQIDKYGREVAEVLEALGHPEALVTAESLMWDFLESIDGDQHKAESDALLEACRIHWGLETLEEEDYVWEVAERIRSGREST